MAERPARRGLRQVQLDFAFDRLRESKLAQAYELLVPGRERAVGARVKETGNADSSDLRASVIRPATGGTYHCEPNGVSASKMFDGVICTLSDGRRAVLV